MLSWRFSTRLGTFSDMANYSIELARTSNPAASLGTFQATATPRRIKLYECTVGQDNTPGDNTLKYVFQRFSAPGTSTAVTPQPLDLADAPALSAAGQVNTVEPTYTAGAVLLVISMNQRATFRWVAPPGGELVVPATNNAGIGIATPVAGGTPTITGDLKIQEQ